LMDAIIILIIKNLPVFQPATTAFIHSSISTGNSFEIPHLLIRFCGWYYYSMGDKYNHIVNKIYSLGLDLNKQFPELSQRQRFHSIKQHNPPCY